MRFEVGDIVRANISDQWINKGNLVVRKIIDEDDSQIIYFEPEKRFNYLNSRYLDLVESKRKTKLKGIINEIDCRC